MLSLSGKVFERRGLLRRVGAGGAEPAIRCYGGELQSVVLWVCAAGCGRRLGVCGGAGVQSNAVQHEARHRADGVADDISERHETHSGAYPCALPHHTGGEGHGGSGGDLGVPPPEHCCGVHRGGYCHRRPFAAVKRAGYRGSGAARTHSP